MTHCKFVAKPGGAAYLARTRWPMKFIDGPPVDVAPGQTVHSRNVAGLAMDAPILRLDHYSCQKPHSLPWPRVWLEVVRGRARRRVRPIQGRVFVIGTASDCDLVLGDLTFPEAFAYVFVHGTDVSIRRLATGPELRVSGERVESAELFSGDSIAFGPFELLVFIEPAAVAGPGCTIPEPAALEFAEPEGTPESAIVRFSQVCGA